MEQLNRIRNFNSTFKSVIGSMVIFYFLEISCMSAFTIGGKGFHHGGLVTKLLLMIIVPIYLLAFSIYITLAGKLSKASLSNTNSIMVRCYVKRMKSKDRIPFKVKHKLKCILPSMQYRTSLDAFDFFPQLKQGMIILASILFTYKVYESIFFLFCNIVHRRNGIKYPSLKF